MKFLPMVLALTACIPCPRTAVVLPAGTLMVKNAAKFPVSLAPIVIERYPLRAAQAGATGLGPNGRWEFDTDERGRAVVPQLADTEWVFPLMPDGVPTWGWEVCVDAPGYGAHRQRWPPPDRQELVVTLRPGPGSCRDRKR